MKKRLKKQEIKMKKTWHREKSDKKNNKGFKKLENNKKLGKKNMA